MLLTNTRKWAFPNQKLGKNDLKYIAYKNQEVWGVIVQVLQKHLLYATTCCANKCPEVCADILWALLPDIIIKNMFSIKSMSFRAKLKCVLLFKASNN